MEMNVENIAFKKALEQKRVKVEELEEGLRITSEK